MTATRFTGISTGFWIVRREKEKKKKRIKKRIKIKIKRRKKKKGGGEYQGKYRMYIYLWKRYDAKVWGSSSVAACRGDDVILRHQNSGRD